MAYNSKLSTPQIEQALGAALLQEKGQYNITQDKGANYATLSEAIAAVSDDKYKVKGIVLTYNTGTEWVSKRYNGEDAGEFSNEGNWIDLSPTGVGFEMVRLVVKSNQENDEDIKKAVITVNLLEDQYTFKWDNQDIFFPVKSGVSYSINGSDIEGYSSPQKQEYTSINGNIRNVELVYNTTITTFNVIGNASSLENQIKGTIFQLTGSVTKEFSSNLSHVFKAPTGSEYHVKCNVPRWGDNASSYVNYVPIEDMDIVAEGLNQTKEFHVVGTYVELLFPEDIQDDYDSDFGLSLKRNGEIVYSNSFMGADSPIFDRFLLDDISGKYEWVVVFDNVPGYQTPPEYTINIDGGNPITYEVPYKRV